METLAGGQGKPGLDTRQSVTRGTMRGGPSKRRLRCSEFRAVNGTSRQCPDILLKATKDFCKLNCPLVMIFEQTSFPIALSTYY